MRLSGRALTRVLVGLVLAIVVLSGVAVATIEWRWTRRFDAPYPSIDASRDPAIVAKGEYIIYSAAACAYCHVPRSEWPALAQGKRLPLLGDHVFPLPFGKVYSANLTPDPATSPVGRWSEDEFVARFRLGERVAGTPMPWGAFAGMTEVDLRAIYLFLRSLPPTIKHTGAAVQAKSKSE